MADLRVPTFGPRGQAFWRSVTADFEADDGETALLIEACRTLDVLDQLAAAVERDGLIVKGSTGQPVTHPAVAEARQQRVVLARLLKALRLDEEEEAPTEAAGPSVNRERARYAAQQRWARPGVSA